MMSAFVLDNQPYACKQISYPTNYLRNHFNFYPPIHFVIYKKNSVLRRYEAISNLNVNFFHSSGNIVMACNGYDEQFTKKLVEINQYFVDFKKYMVITSSTNSQTIEQIKDYYEAIGYNCFDCSANVKQQFIELEKTFVHKPILLPHNEKFALDLRGNFQVFNRKFPNYTHPYAQYRQLKNFIVDAKKYKELGKLGNKSRYKQA